VKRSFFCGFCVEFSPKTDHNRIHPQMTESDEEVELEEQNDSLVILSTATMGFRQRLIIEEIGTHSLSDLATMPTTV
jgi:hypothetical protein